VVVVVAAAVVVVEVSDEVEQPYIRQSASTGTNAIKNIFFIMASLWI